ncbi:MCE family protein [Mumia zhuanghuii]|uniref:MlaD family protein n=2 Tax=Mumia TaxID=1546255 RepID=A0ABW1QQB1_9ACTN|nr:MULTISPECIES: MlaD family protein [Mumia]KAA1423932.1 MCE family protein [Mumia zhuanghuii]
MLTSRTKTQLAAFTVLAVVGTTYLGAKYVGIDPFSSDYRVTVSLPEAGGIFENGEVTYLGVPVGRIETLTNVRGGGVEAVLRIESDTVDIPADVSVQVANRSTIGEQYVDLSGTSGTDEVLADGDRLSGGEEAIPQDIDVLLNTARDFTASVPEDSLNTVIDESYDFSQGANLPLRRLVDTSLEFHEVADRNFLVSAALIKNSETVLETQQAAAESIKSYSADLSLLATTMADSDADLRSLIANSPAAAREVDQLFTQVGQPLGVLMSNLVSTAQVFGTNASGVEDALIRVPEAISVGWAVNGSKGMNLGLATTFFDPPPCTAGYGGTTKRPGTVTSAGKPFNTKAGCDASPSSGTNVRGPNALPKSGGKGPAAARVSVPDTLGDLLGGNE